MLFRSAVNEESQREKRERKVKFADEDSEDSAEYFEDEKEEGKSEHGDDYDSEEDEGDQSEEEKAVDGVQLVKPKKEDAMRELEKVTTKFKAAEGVRFTRYDQYGVPMEPDQETGFDYQKHIARGEMPAGEGMFIEAPPEMVAQMYAKPKPGI